MKKGFIWWISTKQQKETEFNFPCLMELWNTTPLILSGRTISLNYVCQPLRRPRKGGVKAPPIK